MTPSVPKFDEPINDQKTEPRIAALKRFLDRLLSQPHPAARVDDEDRHTANELGLTGSDTNEVTHASLVEMTRQAIRTEEPVREADQSLEAMSAPPAAPATVP